LLGAFQNCLCKAFPEGWVKSPKKINNNSSEVQSNAN
jgi:hypothetical protein